MESVYIEHYCISKNLLRKMREVKVLLLSTTLFSYTQPIYYSYYIRFLEKSLRRKEKDYSTSIKQT